MRRRGTSRKRRVAFAAALAYGALAVPASAATVQLSSDQYTSANGGQHATEVEPDSFAWGSTIVAGFQVGRFSNGGAVDNGWATSTDSGATWTHSGVLPGLTAAEGGTFARATDPSVAYDLKHQTWLIGSLGLGGPPTVKGEAIVVKRSDDGLSWTEGAVTVSSATGASDYDKPWVVCDNTASSAFYGNCYASWDDFGESSHLLMSTSTDGGKTWGAAKAPSGTPSGLGGQPLVRPNGTVVVPYEGEGPHALRAFRSTDGGANWGAPVTITAVDDHQVPGSMRSEPLPSAEIDGAGRVYVAWHDCRFRPCDANDISISSSSDGVSWTSAKRVPIDSATSPADDFTPGLAVDRATSGAGAHLGVAYHRIADNSCLPSDCRLAIGFIDSLDGGATWSKPVQLSPVMKPSWLANTDQGYMTGDYISTSFANGLPHPVFASASAPASDVLGEAIFSASPPMAPPDKPPPDNRTRTLTQLAVNPKSFTAAPSGPSIIRKASGTTVSYRSSALGVTTFYVRRQVTRQGAMCGPKTNGQYPTCKRWVRRPGTFEHTDRKGLNSFMFTGRVGGVTLRPGRFQLAAEPKNEAGNVGPRVLTQFTIVASKARARKASRRAAPTPRLGPAR